MRTGRRSGAWAVAGAVVLLVVAVVVHRRSDSHAAAEPVPGGALVANASVVHIVDGDTVDFLVGGAKERVRLIGINTPETVDPKRPVECYGPEAKAYTTSLLPVGTAVLLERDVEPRDDYGRLLGYVHRAADGVFVNLELAWQGYAVPLTIEPNTAHAGEFVEAAKAAQRARRGLWGACDG